MAVLHRADTRARGGAAGDGRSSRKRIAAGRRRGGGKRMARAAQQRRGTRRRAPRRAQATAPAGIGGMIEAARHLCANKASGQSAADKARMGRMPGFPPLRRDETCGALPGCFSSTPTSRARIFRTLSWLIRKPRVSRMSIRLAPLPRQIVTHVGHSANTPPGLAQGELVALGQGRRCGPPRGRRPGGRGSGPSRRPRRRALSRRHSHAALMAPVEVLAPEAIWAE